jgi:hypothetical protein
MNPANPRKADFEAVDHLGTGGFGVVYLVRRLSDGKVFATYEGDGQDSKGRIVLSPAMA